MKGILFLGAMDTRYVPLIEPLLGCLASCSTVLLYVSNTIGVHLNGYVRNEAGVINVWVAQRSFTKSVNPGFLNGLTLLLGMLDNLVGGGIAEGSSPADTIIKESGEEAGITSEELLSEIRPCGNVTFYYDCPVRGWQADTEYVFDIELPASFQPKPEDGEVEGNCSIVR
jgi:8-oxo-dGTP pyrophosphatase MutT (NUDIX family)